MSAITSVKANETFFSSEVTVNTCDSSMPFLAQETRILYWLLTFLVAWKMQDCSYCKHYFKRTYFISEC